MSDGWVVTLVAAVWLGAALPVPHAEGRFVLMAAILVLVLAMVRRHKSLLVVGALLLASVLSHRSNQAYVFLSPQPFDGTVQLVGLSEPLLFGERAEAKLPDGSRIHLMTGASTSLRTVPVGSTLRVEGNLKRPRPSPWIRSRHIVGVLNATSTSVIGDPGPFWLVPNAIRAVISRGARTVPSGSAALYEGLVVGDDRSQSTAQQAFFRAAGLSHLLAVSGQNVAFLLALASPVLLRLNTRWRLVAAGLLLVFFAMVTQAEPSVLRATVTGGLGYWAFQTGRPATGLRLLSLSVSLLVLVDPFLVSSVGFQLSVGASAGILLLGPVIRNRIPGPAWIADPMSVTLAAQIAVSPILIGVFGPLGVVSLPANMAAGWAAGLVMAWGMSVGVIAGIVPQPVGQLLMLPVRVPLWWIAEVAHRAATAGLPTIGAAMGLTSLAALLGVSLLAGRHRRTLVLMGCGIVLLGILPLRSTASERPWKLSETVSVIPGTPTVVVMAAGTSPFVVDDALAHTLINVDLLVLLDGGRSTARAATVLMAVLGEPFMVAPPDHRVVGAHRLLRAATISTDYGALVVAPARDKRSLTVHCLTACSHMHDWWD